MVDESLKSICHCGDITLIVPRPPEEINECQCTICRRYAAAWGYYRKNEVKFEMKEGAKVSKYIWGDRESSFNFCANCGCVCYAWPFEEKDPDGGVRKFGVNTRNMDPMALFYITRKIDKAWVLQPVNNKAMAHRDDKAQY